jgi:hypothetical protein
MEYWNMNQAHWVERTHPLLVRSEVHETRNSKYFYWLPSEDCSVTCNVLHNQPTKLQYYIRHYSNCHTLYVNTVKPVLNGPFIKRNFVLNGNIFRSRDYHSIPWSNRNLASAEKCYGPFRFRLRQVLLTKIYSHIGSCSKSFQTLCYITPSSPVTAAAIKHVSSAYNPHTFQILQLQSWDSKGTKLSEGFIALIFKRLLLHWGQRQQVWPKHWYPPKYMVPHPLSS